MIIYYPVDMHSLNVIPIELYCRQVEDRVKHLEGERLDYKGWSYQPVSSTWTDYGRWQAVRLRDQHEQFGHYAQ